MEDPLQVLKHKMAQVRSKKIAQADKMRKLQMHNINSLYRYQLCEIDAEIKVYYLKLSEHF